MIPMCVKELNYDDRSIRDLEGVVEESLEVYVLVENIIGFKIKD